MPGERAHQHARGRRHRGDWTQSARTPQHDGKITGEQLDEYCQSFENDLNHEHMVYPGCVYISQPTEYGTVYTREELASISQVAHDHNLPLYVDGARLGMALTADMNDVQLPDLARLADVFTIGGTKCGTMFRRGRRVPAR